MKRLTNSSVVLFLCAFLSGCELLCQAGTMRCGMTNEQIERLLNSKAYGEYWTKPGMTKESWQHDWVACGGMANGQYSGNVPLGSSDAISNALWSKTRKKLDDCMQAKGYEYHYTGP